MLLQIIIIVLLSNLSWRQNDRKFFRKQCKSLRESQMSAKIIAWYQYFIESSITGAHFIESTGALIVQGFADNRSSKPSNLSIEPFYQHNSIYLDLSRNIIILRPQTSLVHWNVWSLIEHAFHKCFKGLCDYWNSDVNVIISHENKFSQQILYFITNWE